MSTRKIILNVAVSLDGLIEGPRGEYDWCFTDQDYGMADFQKRIDSILYGRKSWEVMAKEIAKAGSNPFGNKKQYVFSNTLGKVEGAHVLSGDAVQKVRELRQQPGKDLWLFGGASLTASLLNAGEVDELLLAIHPIILGDGKPLFNGIEKRISSELLGSKPYSSGLVMNHYQIKK